MQHVISKFAVVALLMMSSLNALADTLQAEFSFTKKPPRLTVIFPVDGDAPPISTAQVDQMNKEFDSPY